MFTLICNFILGAIVLGGTIALIILIIGLPFWGWEAISRHLDFIKGEKEFERWKGMGIVKPIEPDDITDDDLLVIQKIKIDCRKTYKDLNIKDSVMQHKLYMEALDKYGFRLDESTGLIFRKAVA